MPHNLATYNQSMSEPQDSGTPVITIYGADWCSDCTRAKRVFHELNVSFNWVDLVETPEESATAEAISGRKNIPVIVYPDGSHQVEPSDNDMRSKLTELGLA